MTKAIVSIFTLFFLAASAVRPPDAAAKSAYTPPGLYDVQQVSLPNGFRVLFKRRTQAHNVSFRLVIGLGSRHFDCKHRETAHIIEHLLFSGTSRHSEAGLERLIEEHGGSWNAETGARSTVYQVDIFDRYAGVAVDTLHEIVTDTVFTPEEVGRVKDIVIREDGGKPSTLRRILYRYDVGKPAWTKANEWLLPGEGAVCPGLIDVEAISDGNLVDSFKSAYVPGNMTLVVVGNFDRAELLAGIRRTFGSMMPANKPPLAIATPPDPGDGPARAEGVFAPFLGGSGYIGVAFRTEGRDSPDAPALSVLSAYLGEMIYEQVRVMNGLSYGPEVSAFFRPDYGILYITADAAIGNLGRVRELIHGNLERITRDPISPEEVERTKRRMLLQWLQGYETNAGTAHFYVENLRELDRFGVFRDHAGEIESVSAGDVNRVAAKYLESTRRVDITGLPTMTYTQFYLSTAAALILAAAALFVALRRRAGRCVRPPS